MSSQPAHQTPRRVFLESSSKVAATSLVMKLPSGRSVSAAAGENQLKIELVGCGGRGGRRNQPSSYNTEEGITLHAMRDANREVMNEAEPIPGEGKPGRANKDGRLSAAVPGVTAPFKVWY